jgi:hypothetical protein
MTKLLAKAAAALLALSASGTVAKAQDNGHSVEILGIHLGMTPGEVTAKLQAGLKEHTVHQYRGKITMGSYTSPEILFGELFREGNPNDWNGVPNVEFVTVNYSFMQNPHVIYISRRLNFDKDTAPGIDDVIKSATAKYGPPIRVERSGSTVVTWNWGGTLKPTLGNSQSNIAFNKCKFLVGLGSGPFGMILQLNFNLDQNEISRFYPQCATTMTLTVQSLSSNTSLAGSIEFDIGDFNALAASYQSTQQTMRANAAASDAVARTKASQNAPKL